MDSSSPPVVVLSGGIIGGQRSNNVTPHHHYYSTPTEQPSSLLSHHGGNRRGNSVISPSPLHHLPPSSRATPRSRGQSPSVNSLDAESNILGLVVDTNPSLPSHLPPTHHLLAHHTTASTPPIIGHGHNHLHGDSPHHHMHINCGDNSSHSISPPNSNSNTTISCGSGNSTSANIGVPTSRDRRNNNNNSNNRRKMKNHNSSDSYENYRNSQNGTDVRSTADNNTRNNNKRGKKSILEDDFEKIVENNNSSNKLDSQRPPFINPNQEFLPICDALFNMISLAAYFCDVVFDVLSVYSWYRLSYPSDSDYFELSQQRNRLLLTSSSSAEVEERESSLPREQMWQWSIVGLVFILLSCVLSQVLSFKWYKESVERGQKAPDGTDLEGPPPPCSSSILVLMHLSLVGVLWRYFKLFIPVDLRFVKNEVRDLCLLRLIHAFCQAAPMLLLQLYIIWHEPGLDMVSDLMKVSTGLSLFSVCWALASFSKHIRRQNVHKLVLTWLGVIFQFFWRLGTVSSRFLALSLYAVVYQYWVFLVLFLHWFCMLLWLISPKNIFHGEKMSQVRKVSYSAIVAVVYTFCYINVQETNCRSKVVIYYVTMFLENCLLLSVWLIAVRYEDEIWFRTTVTWAVFICFAVGLFFMCFYYKYFHVKKLSYVYDAESSIYRNTSSIGGCSLMNDTGSMVATISGHHNYSMRSSNRVIIGGGGSSSVIMSNNKKKAPGLLLQKSKKSSTSGDKKKSTPCPDPKGNNDHHNTPSGKSGSGGQLFNKLNGHHVHHSNVPGVFNCRFHPAMKRKKKKPTSFVPPPAVQTENRETTTQSAPISHLVAVARAVAPSPVIVVQKEYEATSPQIAHTTENFVRASPHLIINPTGNHSHHHHHQQQIDHYESSIHNSSNHCGGSLSPHYDLPEYESNVGGPGLSNGSASSSYGPILPGMYPSGIGNKSSSSSGRMMMMATAPFWRRPLSLTMGSENEGSVSSRIDIQQKLQEKKQQQLAELREIEEEIKQGKLKRPELHEILPQPVNQRQQIPIEKKQPWFGGGSGGQDDQNASPGGMMVIPPNSNGDHHPEILLDPHQYLMYATRGGPVPPFMLDGNTSSGYYYNPDWPPNYYEPVYQNGEGLEQDDEQVDDDDVDDVDDPDLETSPQSGGGGTSGDNRKGGRFAERRRRYNNNNNGKGGFQPSSRESIYKSYRIPSDIDSQMSLPRSYTLPREFKYKRKFRKPVKTENFLPSTNSSDGDVDSGEDAVYSQVRPYPLPLLPSMHHIHNHHPHHQHNNSAPAAPTISATDHQTSITSPIASSTPTGPNNTSATRHSRKIPNGRPRHKLHETKL